MEYFILWENVILRNEDTFTLASSVEDDPIILNEMTYRVSARYWLIYISVIFVYQIFLSKLTGDQLELLLSIFGQKFISITLALS